MMMRLIFLLFSTFSVSIVHSFTPSFQRKSVPKPLLVVHSSAVSSLEKVFNERLSKQIADEVSAVLRLPIPDPIVKLVLTRAIQAMACDLTAETREKLQDLLAAEKTASSYDDVTDVEPLANQIAQEINPKIDVPLIDETQEFEILRQIVKVVLETITKSYDWRQELISAQLDLSRNLFASDETRQVLVKQINAAIDIPLLDEGQEEKLLSAAIQSCADTLQNLLPPDLISTLKGESKDGLVKMKAYLIKTVNEKVDLIGLDEKAEEALIEATVNILVDHYVGGTDAEVLLLSVEEQEARAMKKRVILEREKELSRKRFEREQAALQAQIDTLQNKIELLQKEKASVLGQKTDNT